MTDDIGTRLPERGPTAEEEFRESVSELLNAIAFALEGLELDADICAERLADVVEHATRDLQILEQHHDLNVPAFSKRVAYQAFWLQALKPIGIPERRTAVPARDERALPRPLTYVNEIVAIHIMVNMIRVGIQQGAIPNVRVKRCQRRCGHYDCISEYADVFLYGKPTPRMTGFTGPREIAEECLENRNMEYLLYGMRNQQITPHALVNFVDHFLYGGCISRTARGTAEEAA